MTLGELYEVLSKCPLDKTVVFDTGHTTGVFSSWRGVYAEISLEPSDDDSLTTGDLLQQTTEVLSGQMFTAYKGGTYMYTSSTPIWNDAWGECTERGVVGWTIESDQLVLMTAYINQI